MHTDAATLLGASGYTLIAVICGLIVLEELGIPMPMLPGDFLLVLASRSRPVTSTGSLWWVRPTSQR